MDQGYGEMRASDASSSNQQIRRRHEREEENLMQFPTACCNRRLRRETNDATAFGMVCLTLTGRIMEES